MAAHEVSPIDPNKVRAEFAVAIRRAGLILDGEPVMDGTLHRVPVEDGKARAKDGTASGSARTGTARTGTASRPATTASPPATGQNGTEKRGLLRLGRAKAEPEPQDDVPTAKVVRQQPVRQAKSKRSGKR